jgi:hypothetical protein
MGILTPLFNVTVLLSKSNEAPSFVAGLTTALFDVPQLKNSKNAMLKNTETNNPFLFIERSIGEFLLHAPG